MTRQLLQMIGDLLARSTRTGGVRALVVVLTVVGAATADAQELAIEPRFDAAGLFHEGIAPVKVGEYWGFVDRQGALVVNPQYDAVLPGSDGRFGVRKGERWGYVTSGGTETIQPSFEEVSPFREGLAAVRQGALWGYIAPDGHFLQPPAFSNATAFDSGFALVVKDGRGSVLFRSGETINSGEDSGDSYWTQRVPPADGTTPSVESVQEISEGRAILQAANRRYFVASDSPSYHPRVYGGYEIARPYSDGLAAVRVDPKRWVYIDRTGKQAISGSFDGARDFSSGVAPAARSNKWGYIDKRGRFIVKPQYDQAYSFADGYAVIRSGTDRGFLEMDGKGKISVYVAPRFEDVFRFSEGLAPVKVNGKWGYLAARRQPVTKPVRGIADLKP